MSAREDRPVKRAQSMTVRAAQCGCELDTEGGAGMLYAKPGYWFPSNTTHCVNLLPLTIAELGYWLSDMARCGKNDCEVCCDWLSEMDIGETAN